MAKVFKVISPTRIKPDVFREEILNELRKVKGQMLKDFQATTKTWTHRVKFDSKVSLPKGTPSVTVETGDGVYAMVSEGTRPHVITPIRPGGVLAFQPGYNAKTSPRVIGSKGGGKFGPKVFRVIVHHPGTEAREFDEVIRQKWQPLFEERMADAIARGAQKCGHGMR